MCCGILTHWWIKRAVAGSSGISLNMSGASESKRAISGNSCLSLDQDPASGGISSSGIFINVMVSVR
jgi:hypothetical protein